MKVLQIQTTAKTLLLITFIFSVSFCFSQFAGGTGTDNDPYLVQTAEHLNNVRNYLTSSFRQIADIDLGVAPYNQGTGWIPIIGQPPDYSGFQGRYNGAGHTISNLYINNPSTISNGLFKFTVGAVLDSISLTNTSLNTNNYTGALVSSANNTVIRSCSVSGSIYSQGMYNGILAGSLHYGSQLIDCHVSGSVQAAGISGGLVGMNVDSSISYCSSGVTVTCNNTYTSAGGLIGYNVGNSPVSHSFATGNVGGEFITNVGGLIGAMNSSAPITNSYATGNVGGWEYVAGFIGATSNAIVENCFAKGNVIGFRYIAGFIINTMQSVNNCYSTGHVTGTWNLAGFAWTGEPQLFVNCYWNTQTSGLGTSGGGLGRTTDEMTYPYAANTYVNWDFTNAWAEDISGTVNGGYPYLRNMAYVGTVATPVFSPPGGLYYSPILVSIQCDTPDALIYYTIDGTEPTQLSSVYTEPFDPFVENHWETEVKARAYKPGYIPSAVDSVHYCFPDGIDDDTDLLSKPIISSICPNPFYQITDVTFSIPKNNKVSLIIYNSKGQRVKILADSDYKRGEHKLEWDGTSDSGKPVSSGVYFCRLKGSDFTLTRKLMLMK